MEQTNPAPTAISEQPATPQTAENNNTNTFSADSERNLNSAAEPATADSEPFLEVKYLKKTKGLSKDEAKDLAEKGLHYSALHDKLDFLAAQSNTTPSALLDSMIKQLEQDELASYREKFGDDQNLLELIRLKQQGKYESVLKDRTKQQEELTVDTNRRIANEFIMMQADFDGELKSLADLPDTVLDAAQNGMPLAYAYLLHKHFQQKCADTANKNNKAAQNLLGSVATNKQTDPVGDRFIKSLWGN